jgi:hypothetical protein
MRWSPVSQSACPGKPTAMVENAQFWLFCWEQRCTRSNFSLICLQKGHSLCKVSAALVCVLVAQVNLQRPTGVLGKQVTGD